MIAGAKTIPGRLYRRLGRDLLKTVYKLPTLELSSVIQDNVQLDPPILDDICLPPYMGPKDHDDLTPLLKIVKSLKPRVVVELGTAHGNIAANICQQSQDAKIYTVNAPAEEQTGILVTYELAREEIGRVYRGYGFSNRVVQIFKNTLDLDLSEYFDRPKVDLAVIDACHDTEYVINDFLKVQPFISPQGIVLFHDTHPSMRDHLMGSYMACLTLRRKGYDIRHVKDTWWAIWLNGARGQIE